jgi:hypothetical protein
MTEVVEMTAEEAAERTLTDTAVWCYNEPREAAKEIIRLRSKLGKKYREMVEARRDSFELCVRAERAEEALKEINAQAVCFVIASPGECFQMLENCAEISDKALSDVGTPE